ncbi:MAG: hypothetical protein ACKVS8_02235 [Phycisphaerales bacterium]
MDEFGLQRSILKEVVKARPSVADGMRAALHKVTRAPGGRAWRTCQDIDWSTGEALWKRWFGTLLKTSPVPQGTELLWFELPSELNPPLTSVSGYAKLGPAAEAYGLDAGRNWPQDNDGSTLPAALLHLSDLERAWEMAGWRLAADGSDERLLPGVYALSAAYVALLVQNSLPDSGVLRLTGTPNGVAVVVGWAGGGESPLGQLTPQGWGPIKRARPSGSRAAEALDPSSGRFNVQKYIAAGLDVNARDDWGMPILGQTNVFTPAEVRALLRAGTDVRIKGRGGNTILHLCGAEPLWKIRLVVAAGADVHGRNRAGETILDRVLPDGRCTLAHVRYYERLGVPLRATLQGKNSGLHAVAEHNLYERARFRHIKSLIRHHARRSGGVSRRRGDGLDPLWVALRLHAREFAAHCKSLREDGPVPGTWDYHHDQVAIWLLEAGADPNARYGGPRQRFIPRGAVPLMLQRYDDVRLVRALLRRGADPRLRCARGRTAVDYARAAAADPSRPDQAGAKQVLAELERTLRQAR